MSLIDYGVAISIGYLLAIIVMGVFQGPFTIGKPRGPLTGWGYLGILSQAACTFCVIGRVWHWW